MYCGGGGHAMRPESALGTRCGVAPLRCYARGSVEKYHQIM